MACWWFPRAVWAFPRLQYALPSPTLQRDAQKKTKNKKQAEQLQLRLCKRKTGIHPTITHYSHKSLNSSWFYPHLTGFQQFQTQQALCVHTFYIVQKYFLQQLNNSGPTEALCNCALKSAINEALLTLKKKIFSQVRHFQNLCHIHFYSFYAASGTRWRFIQSKIWGT